jgi:2-aminoethylphosphonate-pyruvate transaminase
VRYSRNRDILAEGMAGLGCEAYIDREDQSYIITTYRYPADPGFSFPEFYARLSALGFVIYPGKLSQEPCFRIANIGHLNGDDMKSLLNAIGNVMEEMRQHRVQRV